MTLRFTKAKAGDADATKPHTLTCVRDDRSYTQARENGVMIRHDLLHYAIETTLGWRRAFYGLVAAGRDIDSFGTRDGVKDTYTDEEGWAEGLAGAMQWPALSDPPPTETEWWALFDTAARGMWPDAGTAAVPVTQGQIQAIRARAAELFAAWDRLPPGGTLELTF